MSRLSRWRRKADLPEAAIQLENDLGPRGVVQTLTNYRVYDPRQKQVIERLERLADNLLPHITQGRGIVLIGPPGTGKSHLISAMAKLVVSVHGYAARVFDGVALYRRAREAIQTKHEAELFRSLTTPHVLCLEDLQPPAGTLTEYQLTLLRDVVHARYAQGLSTWVSSNLDSYEDAARVLSTPVLERIAEGAVILHCDWPSYRQRVEPEF